MESLRTEIIGTKEKPGKIDQYFGKLYGQFIHPDYYYDEDSGIMMPLTSLFNTNTDSFSNIVVTDLLNQKVINEDALPEFEGTKIEKYSIYQDWLLQVQTILIKSRILVIKVSPTNIY